MSKRILITSGPTREYLDPVRYLSNASSGRMGAALAQAAIDASYQVTVVSGPVAIEYPGAADVVEVESTQEMLSAVLKLWPDCVGIIAAAAPSDFRAGQRSESKIKRTGKQELTVTLVPNPDILATVGDRKQPRQWSIGFALETENGIENAAGKLKKKNCDLVVLNDPSAINADASQVRIIDGSGEVVKVMDGSKADTAEAIIEIAARLRRSSRLPLD